jgi:deazaflavin-dependent oxidoreductase (nitroreductase family)
MAVPEVEIQVWGDVIPVLARTGSAADKQRVWPTMVAVWPDYEAYQAASPRNIPVVLLRPR